MEGVVLGTIEADVPSVFTTFCAAFAKDDGNMISALLSRTVSTSGTPPTAAVVVAAVVVAVGRM